MKTRLYFAMTLLVFFVLVALPNSFAQQVPLANVPFDTAKIPDPVLPPAAVRDFFQLDPYYQQWINVRGFPVLASAEVSPYTLKEAAWIIGHMVGHRPDILRTLGKNKARCSIIPHNKHIVDIPEHDFGRLNFFFEIRQRGGGGRIMTSAEENIYHSPEVIHEFAHQVHDYGLGNWGIQGVDPTFDKRLNTLYNMAKKEGLYQNRYAGSNKQEYWAEGAGSWFHGSGPDSVAHTRSALKKYDPRLAKLLTEVFGDGDWRYTPPATRTHLPHLHGFNPEEAPIYQRPIRLLKLEAQLIDPNSDGDGKWVNLKLHDPSELPRLLNSAAKNNSNSTELIFVNFTETDLSLSFFDPDRKKILHQYITPNVPLAVEWTWVGAIWLIEDHTGKDLAVFRAEEQVGRVLIGGPPSREVLDVNSDGSVDLLDLIPIVSRYGRRGTSSADINRDRIVNVVDILWIAASVSALPRHVVNTFNATAVRKWLTDAKQLDPEDEYQQKGIVVLEHLLTEIESPSKSTKGVTGPLKAIFDGHTNIVWAVAFSPDGQRLASSGWDHTIRVWNTGTKRHEITLIDPPEVMTVAFSPDGQTLVSGNWGNAVRLWDPSTGALKRTLIGQTGGIESVVFSPDGGTLASGSADGTIRLWDPSTGKNKRTLTGQARPRVVVFSPDGNTLASGGSDHIIRLWNPHNGTLKRTLTGHTDWVEGLAFSPDGNTLASGGGSKDRTLRLWDPSTGKLKRTFTGYTSAVSGVAFSPNGRLLASSGWDNKIRLWNTETGKDEKVLEGHTSGVTSVAFSPDGRMLVSGGDDRTVLLWELPSGVDIDVPQPAVVVQVEASERPPMYWIDTGSGTLYRLIGTDVENLVPNVWNATGLAIDVIGGKLYWTEKTSDRTGKIRRANLDGTNVKLVKELTSVPHGIALDTTNGKLYVTNSWGKVQRLNVDGSNFHPNLITDLDTPRGVALDIANGKVYWTEASGRIRRANLNGSNVQNVATRLRNPAHIAIFKERVYWTEKTDENTGEIRSANLRGTPNVTTDHAFSQHFPVGIAVDPIANKLYWTTSDGSMGRSNLDGSDFQPTIVKGLSAPGAFALGVELPVAVEPTRITPTDAVLHLSPASIASPTVGERLTLNLQITGGEAVAGYQVTFGFDATALRYVESSNGEYLPTGAFFAPPVIKKERVELAASAISGVSDGDGTLATITFEVLVAQASTLTLSEGLLADSQGNTFRPKFEGAEVTKPVRQKGDVNSDGLVNIQDLVLVASNFGKTGQNPGDVNGDGVVNIGDLVLVAGALGNAAAAPAVYAESLEQFTAEEVRQWLSAARVSGDPSVAYQRGVLMLERLLLALVPKETALLPNYPNPFNPETWIPYQLAKSGDVTVRIYDVTGGLVRTLALGHQPVGIYQSRSRAAYWDGKNDVGESVASGVYFYTLTAGGFTATRKMLIRK